MNDALAVACSTWQAIDVWDSLRDALGGRASHGCDAEIYAYRLGYQDPSNDADCQRAVAAAFDLAVLCEAFATRHGCRITLDSCGGWLGPRDWSDAVGGGFTWRVLVRVLA